MMSAVVQSMKQRTGRTVEEWVDLVRSSGIDLLDQKAVRRWLKDEHGVLQNSQWAIAEAAARAAGWEPPETEEYVDRQYAGPRADLRPIFNRLREIMEGLGDDVMMQGRSTYIPFVRKRQFAAIASTTPTRIDVGLRYRVAPSSDLLVPANAPGQATHKLSLISVEEITDEVADLLRTAYEQNG